ncbi:MAG: hypothetical protein LOY03_06115 [Cyclobacteriaceae bacterium]|jgi:hypothetical protein|nr:hypothetical protein [Cyclobacteriaceae bacterium]
MKREMKSVLIVALIAWTAVAAHAQEPEEIESASTRPEVAARIDAARAAYITERLGLTTEEAERFWPIYREFAGKRQELRQQYREARRKGVDEKEYVELGLQIRQQELDLEKDYSGRMMQAIPAQKLVRLRNAEQEFTRIVLRQIQQRRHQMDRRQDIRERHQERLRQRNN